MKSAKRKSSLRGKIRSMTGYGSAEGIVRDIRTFIEIKSVNHRYCDINLKLPPRMGAIEPKIRNLLKEKINRGRIEIFFKERDLVQQLEVKVNLPLLKSYEACFKKIKKTLNLPAAYTLLDTMRLTDLVYTEEKSVSYEARWKEISRLLLDALGKFERMRLTEGDAIKKSQLKWLKSFEEYVDLIEEASFKSLNRYRERLMRDFGKNASTVDVERVEVELGAIGDRIDIVEEMERLKSHIGQYKGFIMEGGAVGRQIDFLLQEMNREVNTLGAKSQDATISTLTVKVKSILEKLREQVQNIE